MLRLAFWIASGLVVYTYVGYPLLLLLISKLRGKRPPAPVPDSLPSVSMIVAAYNEEAVLREKLENTARLEYPAGKLEVLVGSDGSTDATGTILREYAQRVPGLRAVLFPVRRGKASVVNDLVASAAGDILVFGDANTMYRPDAIRELVAPFADPVVGGTCGQNEYVAERDTSGGHGEVSYWSYENTVKKLESAVGTLVGATGGIYALRRALFQPLPVDRLVQDDLVIPLRAVEAGYRISYVEGARAQERATGDVVVEYRRRARISATNYSSLSLVSRLLDPRRGFIAFAFWSHKIIRWTVPLLLLVLAACSVALAPESAFFRGVVIAEVAFLVVALAGLVADRLNLEIGPLGSASFFLLLNVGLLVGFFRYLRGTQRSLWTVER